MSWSFLDFTGLSHFFGKLPEKLVTTETTQTISGTKSFSSTILGSVSGSAASASKDGSGNIIADTYATKTALSDAQAEADAKYETQEDAATHLTKTEAASAYVQAGNANQTIGGTKTFSNPVVADITGNAATATQAASATKLAAKRTIALSGAATGTATDFDGTANIAIPVTSLDASKLTGTASVSTTGNAATATTATTAKACTGNAASATKLQTARTINGTGFDGTANITTANWGTARNISITDGTNTSTAVSVNGSANVSLNLPATIKATFVGNITGNVTGNCSGSSGSCTGNAATATKATGNANGKELTNTIIKGLSISGKTITYTQIDGTTGTLTTQDTNTDTLMTQNVSTTNATYPVLLVATADATANQGAKTGIFAKSVKVNPSTNVISASGFSGPLTGNVTGNCSGSSGSCTGNSATATKLATARTIALSGAATGTATGFDGSGNITIPVTALSGSAITSAITIYDLVPDGAANHRNLYRGKDITAAFNNGTVSANIANGTFKDIFPGDYITKQITVPQILKADGTTEYIAQKTYTVKFIIADLDVWLNRGDTGTTAHHVTIVPQSVVFNSVMNETNTTEGGYAGSFMNTNVMPAFATALQNAFGASHLISFRYLDTVSVNNSLASLGVSGWTGAAIWGSQMQTYTCHLLNETMVYGAPIFASSAPDEHMGGVQFAAFRLNSNLVYNRQNYWLSDVVSSAGFAFVYGDGSAGATSASSVLGVRPFALLV